MTQPAALTEQSKFREDLHAMFREAGLQLAPDYFERVMANGNLDDRRKALELIVKTTGAEAEKKADPNANLPVFNFVFQGGGIQATAVPQLVEEVQPPQAIPVTQESLAVLDMAVSEPSPPPKEAESLDDMLSALDSMLEPL